MRWPPDCYRRATAYLTDPAQRVLVFDHIDVPEAGTQVPAGGIHQGEDPAAAVLRELEEESGITGARIVRKLGEAWRRADVGNVPAGLEEQVHHAFHLHLDEATAEDSWDWDERSGGEVVLHRFRLRWVSLEDAAAQLFPTQAMWLEPLRCSLAWPPEEEIGEVLESTRTEVRRVGDTIRRTSGPWSRSVHALLRHLESAGFPGSPRVVGDGFDDDGRERLSYLEGEFVHPQAWSDEGITALGGLLRDLHDASAGFVPPDDAAWQPWFTRSDAPDAVYGHGDLGPWNIVARDGLPVGFIDWEFAGPVDRLDEVAQAAWLNAQLHDDDVAARNQLPSAEQRARQLRLFVDAYGLTDQERAHLVTRMVDHAVRDAGNELVAAGRLKMAKAPIAPDDPGWAVAWRIRSAAWLVAHRRLLENAVNDRENRL